MELKGAIVQRHDEDNIANCKLEVSKVATHTVDEGAELCSCLCPSVWSLVLRCFNPLSCFVLPAMRIWCHSCY